MFSVEINHEMVRYPLKTRDVPVDSPFFVRWARPERVFKCLETPMPSRRNGDAVAPERRCGFLETPPLLSCGINVDGRQKAPLTVRLVVSHTPTVILPLVSAWGLAVRGMRRIAVLDKRGRPLIRPFGIRYIMGEFHTFRTFLRPGVYFRRRTWYNKGRFGVPGGSG